MPIRRRRGGHLPFDLRRLGARLLSRLPEPPSGLRQRLARQARKLGLRLATSHRLTRHLSKHPVGGPIESFRDVGAPRSSATGAASRNAALVVASAPMPEARRGEVRGLVRLIADLRRDERIVREVPTTDLRCQRGRTRLRVESFEQRLCLFEVGGGEALGEPAVDWREQVAGCGAAILVAP